MRNKSGTENRCIENTKTNSQKIKIGNNVDVFMLIRSAYLRQTWYRKPMFKIHDQFVKYHKTKKPGSENRCIKNT